MTNKDEREVILEKDGQPLWRVVGEVYYLDTWSSMFSVYPYDAPYAVPERIYPSFGVNTRSKAIKVVQDIMVTLEQAWADIQDNDSDISNDEVIKVLNQSIESDGYRNTLVKFPMTLTNYGYFIERNGECHAYYMYDLKKEKDGDESLAIRELKLRSHKENAVGMFKREQKMDFDGETLSVGELTYTPIQW